MTSKQIETITDQTLKGSALYVAGMFTTMGTMMIITEGKEWQGIVCLFLGAIIYLVREIFLKKK